MKMKDKTLNTIAKLIEHDGNRVLLGWPPCLSGGTHQPTRPQARQHMEKLANKKEPKKD